MKIVHSFWSKPALTKEGALEKFNGGWRHPKYHLMSWALSCLSFKKHYGEIELVTDTAGKHLLIDQLKLPYTNVRVELDNLNHYPEQLWALGKLYTYGLQEEPFMHVDGDAYIWGSLGSTIEKAQIIGHHFDIEESHYIKAMNHLKSLNFKIPELLLKDYQKHKKFKVSCAGIIGGSNINFFKNYAKKAIEFIDENVDLIDRGLHGELYALMYEQYFFSAMARKENVRIEHVFDEKVVPQLDLVNFMNKYGTVKYVHMLSNMKSCFQYSRRLEHMLFLEYPEYHRRITKIYSS